MFSFSLRWLWAQCFAIALGFLLLERMALPGADQQDLASGTVTSIEAISRKGIGSFYELSLQADDGSQDRVLIAREVAPESAVHSLLGRHIRSHVNWSAAALDLTTQGSIGFDPDKVRQASEAHGAQYHAIALFMAVIGLVAGLFALFRARLW